MSLGNNHLPIGIFDSGMGGLTVLRELIEKLPHESFVYLGDTARLPYGTKSQATITRYALQMVEVLMQQNIKLLVVACNTASTAALPYLKQQLPHLPIIGVVEPGAQAAVRATRNNKVALLATEATIASGIYQQTLRNLNPCIYVLTQSCGLFVALAEEGCIDDEVAAAVVHKYLDPLLNHRDKCDCIILGCTHFPVLINPLLRVLDYDAHVINSAEATAAVVSQTVQEKNLHNTKNVTEGTDIAFLVTDLPERFARIGELFLGRAIDLKEVRLIDP